MPQYQTQATMPHDQTFVQGGMDMFAQLAGAYMHYDLQRRQLEHNGLAQDYLIHTPEVKNQVNSPNTNQQVRDQQQAGQSDPVVLAGLGVLAALVLL